MVPLDSLQVDQAADGQPLFVPLAAVDHPENMLRQDFSRLHDHRLIAGLHLLIDGERAFDGGRCNDLFDRLGSACVSGGVRSGTSMAMSYSRLPSWVMTSSLLQAESFQTRLAPALR